MVQVGDPVGEPHDLRLERRGRRHRPRVVHDPVAHLPREVQPLAVVLEVVDDPERLLRVAERPAEERRERLLPQVPERRVPEVVPEGDRLREVLVQPERPRRRPRDLRHVERVREPDPIVVALRRQEHLRLVLQAPERLGVHDPVPVALVDGAEVVVRLVALPPLRRRRELRALREDLSLDLFGSLTGGRHRGHGSRAVETALVGRPILHPEPRDGDTEARRRRKRSEATSSSPWSRWLWQNVLRVGHLRSIASIDSAELFAFLDPAFEADDVVWATLALFGRRRPLLPAEGGDLEGDPRRAVAGCTDPTQEDHRDRTAPRLNGLVGCPPLVPRSPCSQVGSA